MDDGENFAGLASATAAHIVSGTVEIAICAVLPVLQLFLLPFQPVVVALQARVFPFDIVLGRAHILVMIRIFRALMSIVLGVCQRGTGQQAGHTGDEDGGEATETVHRFLRFHIVRAGYSALRETVKRTAQPVMARQDKNRMASGRKKGGKPDWQVSERQSNRCARMHGTDEQRVKIGVDTFPATGRHKPSGSDDGGCRQVGLTCDGTAPYQPW